MDEKLGKGIEFYPFKTDDKHYYGGFFNLADNNIKEVFDEIGKRLKVGKLNPVAMIEKYTHEKMSIVEFERFVNILADYFPIVDEIDQVNYKASDGKSLEKSKIVRYTDFRVTFIRLLESIEKLRNFYTHYYHDEIELDSELFLFLDNVLFKTVLDTKKKYLKTDKTKELLKDSLQDEIEKLIVLKIESLKKKKEEVNALIQEQKRKGIVTTKEFRFSDNVIEIRNSILNDATKPFIYEDENNSQLSNRKKTAFHEKGELTENSDFKLPISSSGIVFLLSLFLTRKEIENLKANIKGYKGKVIPTEVPDLQKNSIMFMTTHRIYSKMCYKGLKNRIKTSESATKETLLMQMVDELSKVPDVVYQNISTDLQKSFIEDWNEYLKDGSAENVSFENSKVMHPVIRKRYEDKFNYFAIRFLDEFVFFPSLRFQVHLGNYVSHSMQKDVGSFSTTREIKKKIFLFGKLNEINRLKNNFFNELEENKLDTNWEFFPNPNYHFPTENADDQYTANKIGIYMDGIDERKRTYVTNSNKDVSGVKEELINEIITKHSDEKFFFGQPIAYLSMNDIHAVLFDVLSKKEMRDGKLNGENVERKIRTRINQQIKEILSKDESIKILKDSANKNNGDINYSKLVADLEKEKSHILTLIDEHESRINDFKYQVSKSRKHILYASEKGKIATWLANDIKRYFPKEFKESWKGYQHSEFQRNLSYYETNKKEVKLLLKDLNYFKEIPFIDFSKDNLSDFYFTYLTKKKDHINNLRMSVKRFVEGEKVNKDELLKKCFRIYKKKNYTSSKIDDKISSILSNPIFLERGFMDDKPTVIHGTPLQGNESQFADWFISFKKFKTRDFQAFYDSEKYPIELKDKPKSESKKINSLIYTQMKNDWSVWLMIGHVFNNLFNTALHDAKLSELFQTREERINNKAKSNSGERNQNYIWNKTINLRLNEKVVIPDVKLKDIGGFRKYEKSKIVNSLLSYNDINNWMAYLPSDWKDKSLKKPINVLQIQIDEYEYVRSVKLLKMVQEVEKSIFQESDDKDGLLQNGSHNFKHYILNGYLRRKFPLAIKNFILLKENESLSKIDVGQLVNCSELEQYAILLVLIRNKFAHNQLPDAEIYLHCQKNLARAEDKTYASYYLDVFELLCEKLGF